MSQKRDTNGKICHPCHQERQAHRQPWLICGICSKERVENKVVRQKSQPRKNCFEYCQNIPGLITEEAWGPVGSIWAGNRMLKYLWHREWIEVDIYYFFQVRMRLSFWEMLFQITVFYWSSPNSLFYYKLVKWQKLNQSVFFLEIFSNLIWNKELTSLSGDNKMAMWLPSTQGPGCSVLSVHCLLVIFCSIIVEVTWQPSLSVESFMIFWP